MNALDRDCLLQQEDVIGYNISTVTETFLATADRLKITYEGLKGNTNEN